MAPSIVDERVLGPSAGRPQPGSARAFAMAVLARESLIQVASVLAPRGIAVMPLKGVLLQLLVYPDPAERVLSDVDVLVLPRDMDRACGALRAEGFRLIGEARSGIERMLRSPSGLTIDLHQRLFSRGRYRLDTEGVFRRAERSTRLGAPLCLPDGRDVAAHLIGKWVSDHAWAEPERARDLTRVIAHYELEPESLVAHLKAHGLARAGAWALRQVSGTLGGSWRSVVELRLLAGHLDRLLVSATDLVAPRLPVALSAVPAHLLNESLVRTGASCLGSVWYRVQSRWYGRG